MSDKQNAQRHAANFIAAIDPIELSLRLIEAQHKIKRPEGTPMQVFLALDQEDQERWMASATAAMEYWRECIKDMQATQ